MRKHVISLLMAAFCAWLTAGCTIVGQSVTTTSMPLPPPEPAITTAALAQVDATPSPTIASTPEARTTAEPSVTAGTSPTPAAIATLLAGEPPRVHSVLMSPDGRYRAEVIIYGCEMGEEGDAYEILRIIETASGKEHIIADQYHGCMGLGAVGLDVLFWDDTGRFMYYTPSRQGAADGAGMSLGRPMLRADVTNWVITNLGGPVGAPDGVRYAGWLDGELVIWTIDGREIGRLPPALDYPELGLPAWSPDGTTLAYFQLSESLFAGDGVIDTAIVVVDSEALENRVAFESDSLPIFEISWLDDERLLLRGFENSWIFDLTTETLSDAP